MRSGNNLFNADALSTLNSLALKIGLVDGKLLNISKTQDVIDLLKLSQKSDAQQVRAELNQFRSLVRKSTLKDFLENQGIDLSDRPVSKEQESLPPLLQDLVDGSELERLVAKARLESRQAKRMYNGRVDRRGNAHVSATRRLKRRESDFTALL